MSRKQIFINENDENDTKKNVPSWRIDFQDLHDSFKRNWQINTNYEISFTLTYSEDYKGVFNAAKEKCGVWYDGYKYRIQQREEKTDEQGMQTAQITATADVIDIMKNIRIDQQEPTEDNPDIDDSSSKSDNNDSDDPKQPGVVTKRTDEQQTYTLKDRLDKFVNNNDQGFTYDLHGNFIQAAVDCSGSLYEWLGSNLKLFGAYWLPKRGKKGIDIYDLASLQHKTGKQFRYLFNTPNADVQIDVVDIVNDCEVYGGKMEKDITTGGVSNGVNEPVNGDWTPVIKNAAAIIGEKLSDADINLIKAQINLESSGREDVVGGNDGLADGNAIGLLQFKQRTFDYYCRPPYTNIRKGLDQLIALMNIPGWRNQITGHSGWSPHGAPISKAELKPQTTGAANQIAEFCKSFVGKVPYVWGGNTPNGWDCSGFVAYVYNHFGIPMHQPTTYEEYQGTVVGPPYQTGDMLFWGSRGSTYHTSIAIDSDWRVGADNERDGTVLMKINQWPPAFGVRNQKMAELAGGNATLDDGQTSTTSQTYYALSYHFEDEDSIKRYGRHRGAPVVVDSIYDMDALKKYVDQNVQHTPQTSLTISGTNEEAQIGDVWRLIVPEFNNMNVDVTVMGISGNTNEFNQDPQIDITLNNTALVMKDINAALLGMIRSVNRPENVIEKPNVSSVSTRTEDHFANIPMISQADMTKVKAFMGGGS